jgi:uncharacterized protein
VGAPYLDTSVVAKWYLNEPFSEEVEEFLRGLARAWVSSLTAVELRCLLARRRRNGEITERLEGRVWAAFEDDISRGYLERLPLTDDYAAEALRLMGRLEDHPLRAMDALHLAVASEACAGVIATADRVMAAAAAAAGFDVVRFMASDAEAG